jgi:hypothetical protein
MIQQILNQGSPPKRTRQWQMSFWCLFDIIDEFRSTKPTLLAFHFSIRRRPTNFSAKDFEISLGLLELFLLLLLLLLFGMNE